MNKKSSGNRVVRELTTDERKQLETARAETEVRRDSIVAEARARKRALEAMRKDAQATIRAMKEERERLGLSLADVEARSGLKRSSLSRLENDPDANPTLLTLQRYADALHLSLSTSVGQP
ncbi:helix-turn-helix protein [Rosistilla ulvae]|uniref:Helix-turn-helix protein n=1 Tax=Rosistilla ulvae TaxID=1930277 RepID=A0A517LTH7_9BACT|nr:helix-turn-helix transcriptional regulator [Rosistilla ulvae]QDS85933.1 helix-turn-helix protein [Rosistilla ulvae]